MANVRLLHERTVKEALHGAIYRSQSTQRKAGSAQSL